MSGNSVISNNSATTSTNRDTLGAGGDGGWVFVAAGGEFSMTGGTISVNKAEGNNNGDVGNGGGVYNSGTFNMTNSRNGAIPTSGTISGNEVDGNGGGVWNNGEFTMTDTLNDSSTPSGTIIGNKAEAGYGGGVYSENAGIFTMENGIMYGLDSFEIMDNELKNNAPKGSTFIHVDQGSSDITENSFP
jgi:hypothetical protein